MFLFCAGVTTHGECMAAISEATSVVRLLALPCAVVWSKASNYCLVQLVELFTCSADLLNGGAAKQAEEE
jgi:hypothetical protein